MTEFTSYIIYRKEWALKWAIFLMIILLLAFVCGTYLNSKPLSIFLFVVMFASFFFIKVMMNYFTRKVVIRLDSEDISFDITKLDGNDGEMLQYKLLDIVSYQLQFPNSRFACLIFKLQSGKAKEFSFRRQTITKTQENTDTIIEVIHKSFEQHRIAFSPSFYASKKGLYTIILLIIILCIPFAIAIYYNKNLPVTIIGSVLIISQILSRRMTDLNFYNKWKRT